jgi:proline iminopeptidase
LPREEALVEGHGVKIYVKTIGNGRPLLILHGGPGADHSYFLPHLVPLARHRRLIFIDERGCGRSERIRDSKDYTLAHMVEDIECVRRALGEPRLAVLGHSFGGILAQAYAIKYPRALTHLVLAGTAPSAALINSDFRAIKRALPAKTRARIAALERRGIYTRAGAYRSSYARLCRDALARYNYAQPHPDMPDETKTLSWEVLREMWVRKSDFRIDGNLRGFDFTESLRLLRLPTLVVIGERDLVSRYSAGTLHTAIVGSRLVIMRDAGHMMFVEQRDQFLHILGEFLLRHS